MIRVLLTWLFEREGWLVVPPPRRFADNAIVEAKIADSAINLGSQV